jgi:hypothetical protein
MSTPKSQHAFTILLCKADSVVGGLCLNLITPRQFFFFLSIISVSTTAYNIQSTFISALATSNFFLTVSTTISDLTISEFILWTINLRKHTNFIQLQFLNDTLNLKIEIT